jgi:hypothetical protein
MRPVTGLFRAPQNGVLLEVTRACTPCAQLDLPPGLPKEIRGRRGMLGRMVKGGIIRRGDAIERLAQLTLTGIYGLGLRCNVGASGGWFLSSLAFSTGSSGGTTQSKPLSVIVPRM